MITNKFVPVCKLQDNKLNHTNVVPLIALIRFLIYRLSFSCSPSVYFNIYSSTLEIILYDLTKPIAKVH